LAQTKKTPIVTSTEIIMPQDANSHGTLFGGKLLELMDKCAAIVALRFCQQPVVTASFERIDFIAPINVGNIIELTSRVIFTGKTSLVIKVDVFCDTLKHAEQSKTTSGYTVFVSVDELGQPIPIPQLKVETKEEKDLWKKGEALKAAISARKRQETL